MRKSFWALPGFILLVVGFCSLSGPDALIKVLVSFAASFFFFYLAFRNKNQVERKNEINSQSERPPIQTPIKTPRSKPPDVDLSIEEGSISNEQMERFAAKLNPCRFCHQKRMHLSSKTMSLYCKNNDCPAFRFDFHIQEWNDWTWEEDQLAYCQIYKANLGLRQDGQIWTENEEGKYPRFVYLEKYYPADFWVNDQDEDTPVEEVRPGEVMYTYLREDDDHEFEDGKITKAYVYMKWQPKNTRSTGMTNDNY